MTLQGVTRVFVSLYFVHEGSAAFQAHLGLGLGVGVGVGLGLGLGSGRTRMNQTAPQA